MIPGYLSGGVRDRPLIPGYRYRARTYPMAVRAIERAQAEHGPPVPTCLCGGRIARADSRDFTCYRCQSCGKAPQ